MTSPARNGKKIARTQTFRWVQAIPDAGVNKQAFEPTKLS